jgi:hypothetical protein
MAANASKSYTASSLIGSIGLVLAGFDLWPAQPGEFLEARALAARLIGAEIVDPEVLHRVHARSGGGLFLTREQGVLTGVLALVLLSPHGLDAIETDRFDGVDTLVSHVARPSEEVAGLYAWGLCASTPRGARRVVAGARAMRLRVVPDLPCFGRAATPAGRRLMVDHLRCRPVPNSGAGFLAFEPGAVLERAA